MSWKVHKTFTFAPKTSVFPQETAFACKTNSVSPINLHSSLKYRNMGFSTTSYYYHQKWWEQTQRFSERCWIFASVLFFLHWSIIVLLLPLYFLPCSFKPKAYFGWVRTWNFAVISCSTRWQHCYFTVETKLKKQNNNSNKRLLWERQHFRLKEYKVMFMGHNFWRNIVHTGLRWSFLERMHRSTACIREHDIKWRILQKLSEAIGFVIVRVKCPSTFSGQCLSSSVVSLHNLCRPELMDVFHYRVSHHLQRPLVSKVSLYKITWISFECYLHVLILQVCTRTKSVCWGFLDMRNIYKRILINFQ